MCDAVMRSSWLLPLLVVMIAVDAPFPILPSETILMSAATTAFGGGDVGMVFGLFVAALAGSVLGDSVVFWLGRCSHKLLSRTVDTSTRCRRGCAGTCSAAPASPWWGRGSCPADAW